MYTLEKTILLPALIYSMTANGSNNTSSYTHIVRTLYEEFIVYLSGICIFLKSLYKHLKIHTRSLDMYVKWACICELNITRWKIQPSLILTVGKIMCILGISTTCTNWDNQCSKETWFMIRELSSIKTDKHIIERGVLSWVFGNWPFVTNLDPRVSRECRWVVVLCLVVFIKTKTIITSISWYF